MALNTSQDPSENFVNEAVFTSSEEFRAWVREAVRLPNLFPSLYFSALTR
jgi:hypothetical protein